MRRLGLILIFPLAACVGSRTDTHPVAPEPPLLLTEPQLIAAHPVLIRRTGRTLSIAPHTEWTTFTDSVACDDYESCERYETDGVFEGRYVGVRKQLWEGSEYLLIDSESDGGTSSSFPMEIGGRPTFSPSGKRLLVFGTDEAGYGGFDGVAVWAVEILRRLRWVETLTSPQDAVWRGNGCVRFTASTDPDDWFGNRRTFHLVEREFDWTVIDELRPGECQ